MMLKILLHRLLRDVARAPRPVPDGPEVPPPVPLAQRRVFFLQPPAGAPLHPLDQVRERLRRPVLDVHVDVVFADHALQYPHLLGIADLHEQIPAPHLDVAHVHVIAVLGDPDHVRRQPRNRVPAVPVVFHRRNFYHAAEVCSNRKSCAESA